MNVKFITLGCKVNQYDSQAMKELFLKNGFESCEDKCADVAVVNSCTVTNEGDKKTAKAINKMKKENPGCLTVLTGCLPQAFPEKAEKMGTDIVLGTKNRSSVVALVKEALEKKEKISGVMKYDRNEAFEEMSADSLEGHTRAFMKIQDGCDRFCSYCIIPTARGHLRSKRIEDIVSEAGRLSKSGYKEVVLTGINLSFYGREIGLDLSDAVSAVNKVSGIERIRLGSLQPDLLDEKMLLKLKENEKLCPQFHLSLQSGSDTVLQRMNRHYTTALYSEVVENIHKLFENATITTDIIVGFPGESDEEFSQTKRFVEKIGFSRVHVFPYSKREGTKAAAMENQIAQSVKTQRKKELISLCLKVRGEFLKTQIGKVCGVIIEEFSFDNCLRGYSENYTPIVVNSSDKSLKGKLCKVRIASCDEENAYADLI